MPPSGRTYLERMVRLVTADRPDLVALQEVPAWAVSRLSGWSGMTALGAVARPALLGVLGRRMTRLAPDVFRSAFNGQANALLVGRSHAILGDQRVVVLKERGATERRVCQIVRLQADDRIVLAANFHATAHLPDQALAEIERVAEMVADDDPAVVCGDFNVRRTGLPGFSPPIDGVDQILVRGLDIVRAPFAWPRERRRTDSCLLSDHAPVEAVVA